MTEPAIERTFWNKAAYALVCSLVVITVIPYGTVHPPIIALFYILVTLCALFMAADSFAKGIFSLKADAVQLPLLLAAAYALVQVVPFGRYDAGAGVADVPSTISLDPFWTLVFALHAVALTVFLVIAREATDSARRIWKVAVLITIFGFLYAFFSVIQSFLSPDRIYGVYEVAFARPFGSFVNRHNFAAVMEMAIAVPLGMLMQGAVSRDKRLLFMTTVALMGVALLMSGSRGGLVALGSQVFMLLLMSRDRLLGGKVWLKAVLAVLLVAGIVLGAAYIGGETSMSRLSETARSEDFSTKRAQIWSVTTKVIADNFPLGAGFGAFGVAYAKHDTANGLERVEQAHNDYLQVLADAGIVGAAIGLFFLFVVFRSGLKAVRVENDLRRGVAVGAFVGVFGVLVHSLFDFVLHTTAVAVMFLMLLALLRSSLTPKPDDTDGKRRAPFDARPASVANFSDSRRGA